LQNLLDAADAALVDRAFDPCGGNSKAFDTA
jgi:hypothetical protein